MSNIPSFMDKMNKERSMKMAIAAVQNVVPKVGNKVPVGGDAFVSPKKERDELRRVGDLSLQQIPSD